jgi:hypothetical protein
LGFAKASNFTCEVKGLFAVSCNPMSEGTDASEAAQPAVPTTKKGRPRQISAGEKAILLRLVPAFNAAATR